MKEPSGTNSSKTSSERKYVCLPQNSQLEQKAIEDNGGHAAGDHLFPFRTEKLSPAGPMVLQ
jgi:hypothetical protein